MTTNTPTPPDPTLETRPIPPTGRAWRIGDVAAYLTVCDRSAAKITQRADAPAPALTLGKVRLWHPEQWERWFHHQAGLDVADAGGPWNDGGDVTINWAATNA